MPRFLWPGSRPSKLQGGQALTRRASKSEDLLSEYLAVRLTAPERERFEAEAAAANLCNSAYLAHRCANLKPRTKTHTTLHPVLYAELTRIANNVNQLTRPLTNETPLPDDHPLVRFKSVIEHVLTEELAQQRADGGANDNTASTEKRTDTKPVGARVSKDLYDQVYAQARAAGMSKAAPFIHAQLFGKAVVVHEHQTMDEKPMADLKRLGDSINLFARARNRGRPHDNASILAAFKAVFILLNDDPLMHPRIEAAISSSRNQSDDRSRASEGQVVQGPYSVPDAR